MLMQKQLPSLFYHLKGVLSKDSFYIFLHVFSLLDLFIFRYIPVVEIPFTEPETAAKQQQKSRNFPLNPGFGSRQVDSCALLALSWLRRADVAVRWQKPGSTWMCIGAI